MSRILNGFPGRPGRKYALIAYLRSNGGGSTFKRHKSLGKQTTYETYCDRNNVLFLPSIQFRRRVGHWEAKIRVAGDFINPAFMEINGNNPVNEVVEQNLPVTADILASKKLQGLAPNLSRNTSPG